MNAAPQVTKLGSFRKTALLSESTCGSSSPMREKEILLDQGLGSQYLSSELTQAQCHRNSYLRASKDSGCCEWELAS